MDSTVAQFAWSYTFYFYSDTWKQLFILISQNNLQYFKIKRQKLTRRQNILVETLREVSRQLKCNGENVK